MKKISSLLLVLITFISASTFAQQKITFPSLDSLTITADLYEIDGESPVIVLCHQGKFSRGEYTYTAKKLNQLGFNCIAIDQRSGMEANKVKNETAELATKKRLPTDNLSAEQDIIAAVAYAADKYKQKIILCGSSYSASLALKIAKTNDQVMAVIAFSPGEFFTPKLNIAQSIAGLNKPTYLASTKAESPEVKKLAAKIESPEMVQYIPTSGGMIGSKALWPENPGSAELWMSFERFLKKFKKRSSHF